MRKPKLLRGGEETDKRSKRSPLRTPPPPPLDQEWKGKQKRVSKNSNGDYLPIFTENEGCQKSKPTCVYEISRLGNRQVNHREEPRLQTFSGKTWHPRAAPTPARSPVAGGASRSWVRAPSSRHAHRTSPVTQPPPPPPAYAILPSRGFNCPSDSCARRR